ncbi:NAD(P)-binding domain-containing protein [Thalassotalea euphylliae]|uniref:4Fe-4S binding protein n=1 Tax=Thalassotalea euphylliae TaxID=1655234 RepID=A0A3E0UCS4_9GAMM|nr:NAD(P)-binding domain-containing protein [Thalassotalea euphylliae]REL34640.1 4Fe-4S binding protein [Thalassotalea euphylliae]
MLAIVSKYHHWLHGQWPDAKVEKLPVSQANGTTNIPGTYIVGDLTGVPLLKFSADTGAKAVQDILADTSFSNRKHTAEVADIVIIGGGVSGYSAAISAKEAGLSFKLIEANAPFSTINNFPHGKPIYTYPTEMTPSGKLQFGQEVVDKESLLTSLQADAKRHDIQPEIANVTHIERKGGHLHAMLDSGERISAHRIIVAIGRSGNYRKLNVPGETLEKVSNRLIDPSQYQGKKLLVVGGGDSALEAAISCANYDAQVTLCHRQAEFSRPKPENVEQVNQLVESGQLDLKMSTQVTEITEDAVNLTNKKGEQQTLANDEVLLATGREAPLEFFRRSKIQISGESSFSGWLAFALFMLAMFALYDWKGYGFVNSFWSTFTFPNNMPEVISGLGSWWSSQVEDRSTLIGTIAMSLKSRSFYYTFLYTTLIAIFGWQRIQRSKTPYVTVQTSVLFTIQLFPLFLLPEIILPWIGYNGGFDAGWGKAVGDALFPSYISAQDLANHVWPDWGHPRAYWHAYSFIFAWPLGVYTVFTDQPQVAWLAIAVVQTFVIIPLIVYKWGKGAYCSWICSCGAMAETMGDQQRHKMPHGKNWNKLNMLGQVILLAAFVMLFIRILGWIYPESWMNSMFNLLLKGENQNYELVNAFSWKWVVDTFMAGVLGFGLYFKYSGRTWCRFACPLAALMHIYARFSKFAIAADKSKCISCNQCTSQCHQGIDVMAFAQKGKPMVDPQCVRCSACVQVCPTGTLSFAEIDRTTSQVVKTGKLAASRVQMAEIIEVKNV